MFGITLLTSHFVWHRVDPITYLDSMMREHHEKFTMCLKFMQINANLKKDFQNYKFKKKHF